MVLKGSHLSAETRQKMSEKAMGRVSPNKGKHLSDEVKQKISKSRIGQRLAEETKQKISKSTKGRPGKPCTDEIRRKISESKKGSIPWNKGLPRTEETKQKISEAETGKNHWNWNGGLSFGSYSPEWTEALRRKVRKRDNYTCQKCGEWGNTVHHIDSDKSNSSMGNLITFCIKCHNQITAKINLERRQSNAILG